MKHTKEPWRLGRFTGPSSYEDARETCGSTDVVADTNDGPYVLACCNINFPDDARANARRIVACVNACAGISDEALDSWMNPPEGGFGHPHGPWPAHIMSLQRAAETLRHQRDEVLSAMQYLRQHKLWANSHAKAVIESALEKVGAGRTAPEGHNA